MQLSSTLFVKEFQVSVEMNSTPRKSAFNSGDCEANIICAAESHFIMTVSFVSLHHIQIIRI